MRYIILLLLSLNVVAQPAIEDLPPIHPVLKFFGAHRCIVSWDRPTARKGENLLTVNEIATYDLMVEGKPWRGKIAGSDEYVAWTTVAKCPTCADVEIRTVDTDGRKSNKGICL